MKKIFTLIAMAAMAISANAQDLPANWYPYKTITWGDITWKNGNNKIDINDEAGTKLYFVMGQGNAYKDVYCEYFISEDSGDEVSRPQYTYIDYEAGETGIPGYGLYYKFTPAKAGQLKVQVWVNKGSRKTVVVKGSTGVPLTPYVDYTAEGYINGQKANYDTPAIDPETGESKVDNQGNPVYEQYCIYFSGDEIKARHDAFEEEQKAKDEEAGKEHTPLSPYVIDAGNQAFWGWITLNVEANESYYIFQLSSQLGFGGYTFIPEGGEAETYVAATADPENEKNGLLAAEFADAVDENGVAKETTDQGSVITIKTANMAVEAVGSSTPTEITPVLPDDPSTGISAVKSVNNADAAIFNIAGQRVDKSYKGLVIKNGVKFIQK